MDYVKSYFALINGIKIITIMVLFAVDFLLGVIVAVKEKTFQLSKIGNFLNTSVLAYFGGYLLVGLAAVAEPAIGTALITTAWLALDGTMVGLILAKVKKLGLPVNKTLT